MVERVARWVGTAPDVLALSFARMADALGNSLLIVVLPLYIARAPTRWENVPTELLVGVAISLYGFLLALGQPFAGSLSDRVGKRKPFILAGLALMACATGALMLAHKVLWIFMLRGIQGLGVALIVPPVFALITSVTETTNRGHAMGVYSTFRMVGFAMGPVLAGVLQVHFGFEAVFLAGGLFLSVAFALVYFIVHEPPSPPRPTAKEKDRSEKAEGFLPPVGILALMFATIVLASSLSMISALENEFNARLSQTALGFGLALSALTGSRLLVQIPIGRWSDRIGRKKLIVGGLLILAPIIALFGYVHTTLELVLLSVVQGITLAAVAAPSFALAGDLANKGREGKDMSFVTMGFGLGLGAGPLVAGWLGGYVGFRVPFYVIGSFAVVAAVTVWLLSPESIGPGGQVLAQRRGGDQSEGSSAGVLAADEAAG